MNYKYLKKYSLLKLLIDQKLVNSENPTIQEILSSVKKTTATRPTTTYRQEIEAIKAIYGPKNPDFDTIERTISHVKDDLYIMRLKNEETIKERGEKITKNI